MPRSRPPQTPPVPQQATRPTTQPAAPSTPSTSSPSSAAPTGPSSVLTQLALTTSPAALSAATAEADLAVKQIMRVLYGPDRPKLVLVPAVPGAGKTYVLNELANAALRDCRDKVVVCTNTNAQTFELVARLVTSGSATRGHAPIYLLLGSSVTLSPAQLAAWAGQVIPISGLDDIDPTVLSTGPFIILANAEKWAHTDTPRDHELADLLLVDEAWQLKDASADYILGLAERAILVGDDGQLNPVVPIDVAEWAHLHDGPHLPTPQALLARCEGPGLVVLNLPVTRRLPADTVPFVAPFYPDRTLRSIVAPGDRQLSLNPHVGPSTRQHRLLEAITAGQSVTHATLPAGVADEDDDVVADGIVSLISTLLNRGGTVQLDTATGPVPLSAEHIMVVVAHRSQRGRLEPQLPTAVIIGTADELQGLQAPLTFGWHPLSGLDEVDDFHSAAGRACVMFSRHQIAHCSVGRAGTLNLLARSLPTGPLVPGIPGDEGYRGWAAHHGLMVALEQAGRVHAL